MARESSFCDALRMARDGALDVVVVDDEEPVRALLGITLGMRREFRVVGEATTGEEAVAVVEATHPDAVVLDLMMPPGLSGMDAIAEIRARCPETKIVVFSALSADRAGTAALSQGADAYIEKISVMRRLTDTIKRVCDYEGEDGTAPTPAG